MALRTNRRRDRAEPQAPVYDPFALPADLAACLESMGVVQRSATEDGPRAIVQIDSSGWIHSVEETKEQLLRRWPALTEAQLRRALRHIGARVRQSATPLPTQRRSWVWDY